MTAQIGERLILSGRTRSMAVCPPLPPDPNLLIPTTNKTFEDKINDKHTHFRTVEYWTDRDGVGHSEEASCTPYTTACWREYVGTWELVNGSFYLVAIEGRFRLAVAGPILADWFTGVLRIKYGRELCYVHMGFGSVTEKELHIKIEAGREVARRTIDNRGKDHDWVKLGWSNLPGNETKFRGDTEI